MNLLFRLRSLLLSLGGLCLCLSPFLAWMKLEIFGLRLAFPGFLWHGAWIGAIGALVLLLTFTGWRRTSLILLLLLGAGVTQLYQDHQQVKVRGDYFLAQWQLRLAPLNEMLAKFNLQTLEIYHRTPPEERLGEGLQWAAAGFGMVGLGWILGLGLEVRRGASWLSVLLGSPRCAQCHVAVTPAMRYCPGCGRSRRETPLCRRCGQELGPKDRYCASCGECAAPP